jgi:hypothetical protein
MYDTVVYQDGREAAKAKAVGLIMVQLDDGAASGAQPHGSPGFTS